MRTVEVQEAKTHLSALLAEVERGATIAIARGPRTIAHLVPAASRAPARPQEADAGQGGAHGNGPDRDPEGTEQTSEDQDRRYRSNPYVAADEADSPWEGRSS